MWGLPGVGEKHGSVGCTAHARPGVRAARCRRPRDAPDAGGLASGGWGLGKAAGCQLRRVLGGRGQQPGCELRKGREFLAARAIVGCGDRRFRSEQEIVAVNMVRNCEWWRGGQWRIQAAVLSLAALPIGQEGIAKQNELEVWSHATGWRSEITGEQVKDHLQIYTEHKTSKNKHAVPIGSAANLSILSSQSIKKTKLRLKAFHSP
ncbi:hypothetical protein ABZP36_003073 [Zizania latifolia]